MKIKEIEKMVGITRANIRYYEDEGLIHPKRNEENNYREYTDDDVKQLERIKVLRTLGIPISDIREMQNGSISLEEVMERRLVSISKEKQDLEELTKVCETIIQQDISYEAVDENILGEGKDLEFWKHRLEMILTEDITKEMLTSKQLNRNLGLMLCWGYFLNVIVAFVFGDRLFRYQGKYQILGRAINTMPGSGDNPGFIINRINFGIPFLVAVVLCIFCYILMYMTANVKMQIVIFHVSALCLTPVISGVYCIVKDMIDLTTMKDAVNVKFGGVHMAIFWLLIMLYIIVLMIASEVWSKIFSKIHYVVSFSLGYTAFWTILIGVAEGTWIFPFLMFFIFTLYLGINWFHTYNDIKTASRYYAISQGCRIMNLAGVVQTMKGKTVGHMVFR